MRVKYPVGTKVRVTDVFKESVDSEISWIYDSSYPETPVEYAVKAPGRSVEFYKEWQIDLMVWEWNLFHKPCCCGAEKLNHPGHSSWCAKGEKR